MSAAQKKPAQQQLQLTYSVGDWVFVYAHLTPPVSIYRPTATPSRRVLARVESATPIESAAGDVWCVRCYLVPKHRKARGSWSKSLEHRRVDRALSPTEITNLRQAGVIPPAGSSVLP